MNPPYGREIGKWVNKAYESSLQVATVVCLLPARTDTRWFHDYVLDKASVEFIKGRLRFSGSSINAPFPNMIAVFLSKYEKKIKKTTKFNLAHVACNAAFLCEMMAEEDRTVKIIKPGQLFQKCTLIRFECGKCGCIFECDKSECDEDTEYRNGISYFYTCPTCGRGAYSDEVDAK